ncbi:Hypothetical protein, putative [Bodo saltans]|uniref:Uncharacterized protein n=1 Tax=Bodo saltans TaxID=75058 RepID=A0A0S4J977_BODSA|nr:Hypothetical protein, putative [Bodo saltans]|eukprot:CUG88060.1 Hypothetical protein, putative [Bodo saltans]
MNLGAWVSRNQCQEENGRKKKKMSGETCVHVALLCERPYSNFIIV